MQRSFDIEFTEGPDDVVAHLSGELDLVARDAIVGEVTRRMTDGVSHLMIDLGAVTFCDSSGLAALLDIKRDADRSGTRLTVRSVPEPVARLFDLADVGGWLATE
ncbi:MAG: STAS domain-containing protein [Acidimicrobiia bacterium]